MTPSLVARVTFLFLLLCPSYSLWAQEKEKTRELVPSNTSTLVSFAGVQDGLAHQVCRLVNLRPSVNLRPQKTGIRCEFIAFENEADALSAVQSEVAAFSSAPRALVEAAWKAQPPFSNYFYKLRRVLAAPSRLLAWIRPKNAHLESQSLVMGRTRLETDVALAALSFCDSEAPKIDGELLYLESEEAYQALLEEKASSALLYWPVLTLIKLDSDFTLDFLSPSCQETFLKRNGLARAIPLSRVGVSTLPKKYQQVIAKEELLVTDRNVDIQIVETVSALVAQHASAIGDISPSLRFLHRESLFESSRLPLHAGARRVAEKENLIH